MSDRDQTFPLPVTSAISSLIQRVETLEEDRDAMLHALAKLALGNVNGALNTIAEIERRKEEEEKA